MNSARLDQGVPSQWGDDVKLYTGLIRKSGRIVGCLKRGGVTEMIGEGMEGAKRGRLFNKGRLGEAGNIFR